MNDKVKKTLSALQNQCARREYCSADILKKASDRLDGDRDAALEVLEALKEEGYVDDSRYAAAFAREKSAISAWGPAKIRYALSGKRIDRNIIEQALSQIDADSADVRMERLLENKFKSLKGDPQAKLKLLKFALGRGYDYDTLRSAVDRICQG